MRGRRLGPVGLLLVMMFTGCGSKTPTFDADGAYDAHGLSWIDQIKPGESVDFYAEVSGPPGAVVERLSSLISLVGYRTPTLVHTAADTGYGLDGGEVTGWPVPKSILGSNTFLVAVDGHSIFPHLKLIFAVTAQERGVYAVGGVNVGVWFGERSYVVRAISPSAFGLGVTIPDSVSTKLMTDAPTT